MQAFESGRTLHKVACQKQDGDFQGFFLYLVIYCRLSYIEMSEAHFKLPFGLLKIRRNNDRRRKNKNQQLI